MEKEEKKPTEFEKLAMDVHKQFSELHDKNEDNCAIVVAHNEDEGTGIISVTGTARGLAMTLCLSMTKSKELEDAVLTAAEVFTKAKRMADIETIASAIRGEKGEKETEKKEEE